ncbi:MAG: helix-turn-helix domain-containing protein [Lachnospiraceae bacterium]
MFNVPTINMAATGRKIMELRERSGLTVKDLQDLFGFATPQAIYKWQHGTAMPAIDNLVFLSVIFQVPIDDILVVNGAEMQISA